MRNIILTIFIISCSFMYAQNQQDTILLNDWDIADTIYSGLNLKSQTGLLFNRLEMDSADAIALNTDLIHNNIDYRTNADLFYRLMYELKVMAIDTSEIIGLMQLYDTTSQYIGMHDFISERIIIPIGIADYEFENVDIDRGVNENKIISTPTGFTDNSVGDFTLNSTYNAKMVAPLYDGFGSDIMGIVFRKSDFLSNHRSINEVISIEALINNQIYTVEFDSIIEFPASSDSIQKLKFTINFSDSTQIQNFGAIYTPDLFLKVNKSSGDFPECYHEDSESISGNRLRYCFIPRCTIDEEYDEFDYNNFVPLKPFILITGYRPPFLGQSYKKTWRLYSQEHDGLLQNLRNSNHDIYIVKFNIHWTPYSHGMQESAELLEKFLLELNQKKQYINPFENVILASSMGADITRLTLLTMEKKHRDNNDYPHHHTRSFISYDGNFFGANLPLAHQYQILSGFYHPLVQFNIPGVNQVKMFMRVYLYATLQQKTVKELLQYHALGSSSSGLLFLSPLKTEYVKPGMHQKRIDYNNALAAVDNGDFFIPMPNTSRNTAISLGRLSGTNTTHSTYSNNYTIRFNSPYDSWRDQNFLVYRSLLRPGFGDLSGNYQKLFHRKKIKITIKPPFYKGCKHKTYVKEMYAIDNSAGSYLNSFGNMISLTSWTYFTLQNLVDGRNYFTHKPVVTALAINPNLWQNNGSMSVDLQNLGLMYNSDDPLTGLVLSNFYGYPNLGNPTNYLDITPFEAIYCDQIIDPHIKLKDAPPLQVNSTTNFILNETQPWYLGLQNRVFGSKIRSNYNYYSRRTARNIVYIGDSVTPTTGKGPYIVLPNITLVVRAGDTVIVKSGTRFTSGSDVTLQAGSFYVCDNPKTGMTNNNGNEEEESDFSMSKTLEENERKVILYPNPTNYSFTLDSKALIPLTEVNIFNLYGNNVMSQNMDEHLKQVITHNLSKGIYFVHVSLTDGSTEKIKIIVP